MTQLVYTSAFKVVESDTVKVPGGQARAFMNDSLAAATIKVTTVNGEDVSLQQLQPGQIVELAVTHIWSTGTDADSVIVFS